MVGLRTEQEKHNKQISSRMILETSVSNIN